MHPCMSARRLRLREAFGVRPLAGAVGPPHCARRRTTPLLPSTNHRMGCSPDAIAHSRARFHPGPTVTIRLEGPVLAGLRDARKASLHRTPWNASLQSRTAWQPSLPWEERAVLVGFVRRAMLVEGRVPHRTNTHSGGKPPQSMRCRDSPRRLRLREAFGVRQLAGAVEEPHCARRSPTPLLPSTNHRMGCSADYIAHSRAGFHPGPIVTIG